MPKPVFMLQLELVCCLVMVMYTAAACNGATVVREMFAVTLANSLHKHNFQGCQRAADYKQQAASAAVVLGISYIPCHS
jgi:hypothetical protein